MDGFIGQEEIRKATGLRDWEKAQAKVRDWEAEDQMRVEVEASPITISAAKEEFLRDAEARNLREKTIYKYRLLLRQLEAFAQAEGVRFLNELDARFFAKVSFHLEGWKSGRTEEIGAAAYVSSVCFREQVDHRKSRRRNQKPQSSRATYPAIHARRNDSDIESLR